jgi:cell division protein FtsQ
MAMSWAIFAFWSSPEFEVQAVEVVGLQSVSQEEIFSQIQIFGKPVFTIDPEAMSEMMLNKFSALDDVRVEVSYPAEVLITVIERLPVIAWEQAGIASWWVDRDGMAFEPLGPSEGMVVVQALAAPPPLPVSIEEEEEVQQKEVLEDQEEFEVKQLLTPEMVEAILFLADNAPENATMIYDGRHGLGWADLDKNWTVYYGKKLDNLPLRLAIYQTIFADITGKNLAPLFISVEYIHAPYYRMKPEA